MVSLPPIIRSVFVCSLVSVSAAGVARGDPPPSSPKGDKEKSRVDPSAGPSEADVTASLKERADDAMKAYELPESYEALKALQAMYPERPLIACNIGLLTRRLKRYVEATEQLTRCMAACTPLPSDRAESVRCKERVAELRMARTKVAGVVLSGPKGATVTVDGRPIDPLEPGKEIFVEPGWREIAVASRAQRVFLRAGTKTPLDFTPPPVLPRKPLASKAPLPKKPPSSTINIPELITVAGWIGAGLAATAGGMFMTVSLLKREEAETELERMIAQSPQGCSDSRASPVHCPAFKQAVQEAADYQAAAISTFAGAGAAALATGAFMILGPSAARVEVGATSIKVVVPW